MAISMWRFALSLKLAETSRTPKSQRMAFVEIDGLKLHQTAISSRQASLLNGKGIRDLFK